MRVKRADRTLIAAGLVTIALGTLFLLDRLEVINVRFGYAMPAVVAAVGIVLLVAGICNVDRRSPATTPSRDEHGVGGDR
jgi:uncharacterized membrane protein YidH (DUF202 family)